MLSWGIDALLSGKFYKIWKKEGLIKAMERGRMVRFRNIHDNAGTRDVVPLAGMDVHGNRYYEDLHGDDSNYSSNSHRWVEFADRTEWYPSARMVPAEWHGWLHKVYDDTPIPGNPHF